MEAKTISIVIPVWNGAKTIEATVKSCLNQTLSPIEILVCDDGSTDNSKEIVQSIGDSRVVWLPGDHSGSPGEPRNRGMSMAKGMWVAICDSDDEWLPTKLEKQVSLAMKLNCKASCTSALIRKNGVTSDIGVSTWKKEIISFKNLLQSNDIVCSSAMIHSSIFKEIGGFTDIVEYGSYADYIYWLRVTTKTNFAYVNEPLVIYDDHPQTSMRKENIPDTKLKNNVFNDFLKWSKDSRNNNLKMVCFRFYISIYKTYREVKRIFLKK